jgi:hypothetical protein
MTPAFFPLFASLSDLKIPSIEDAALSLSAPQAEGR